VSAIDEFEAAREDLEALLIEVLGAVFNEEAMPAFDEGVPPGRVVRADLAIHDESDDSFTIVEVRVCPVMARVLAARMMGIPSPSPEDLMDAVGELGNIIGGNVKSLLRHSCRLSLPSAEVAEGSTEPHPDAVVVRSVVLGQVVELSVRAAGDHDGKVWPGAMPSIHAMESQP
jgi:chemotaxis protein CheX